MGWTRGTLMLAVTIGILYAFWHSDNALAKLCAILGALALFALPIGVLCWGLVKDRRR